VADVSPPHPSSSGGAKATRRTVLAGLVGGAVLTSLAACSNEPHPGTRRPDEPAGLAPDVAVATAALAEIRAARAAVAATIRRFPATRPDLGALVQLHTTHAATLADAVPPRASTSPAPVRYAVPHHRDKALTVLAAHEQHLHDSLDGLALRAQSGQFARLLASMGTAVHQRLAAWPS